jgi:hypothetical protein
VRSPASGALASLRTVVAANGIDDVALLVLATETLEAGRSTAALLLAAVGIGLLTGPAWAVAAAFTVQLLRGIGIAAMDVASNTLLQRLVPDRMLGRVFSNL